MIEVYWGSGSGPSWRVLLALTVKKVPFESKLLSFSKREHKSEAFLAINPRGKVPAIRDGAYVLNESIAILAYLDRKHPDVPLFGDDPEETGNVWRQVLETENHFAPALNAVSRPVLFNALEGKEDEVRKAVPALHDELAHLEKRLEGRDWLVGSRISAADIVTFTLLQSLLRAATRPQAKPFNFDFYPLDTRYPRLAAWVARIESIPGYDATYPPHWREG